MLTSGASERDLQVSEIPALVILHSFVDQSLHVIHELLDALLLLEECDHFGIDAGQLSILFIFPGVRQKAAVENKAAPMAFFVTRNTVSVGKTVYPHRQLQVRCTKLSQSRGLD